MRRIFGAVPALSMMLVLFPPGARAEGLRCTVRDVLDGRRMPAKLSLECPSRSRLIEAKSGQAALDLEEIEGRCRLRASSPGYRDLVTSVSKDSGGSLPMTLWLDPSARKKERPESGNMISGYLYDASSGKALVGALVDLEYLGNGAVTDERGYFEFSFEFALDFSRDEPPEDRLMIRAEGYRRQERSLFLSPGRHLLLIDLQPGEGKPEKIYSHKMLDPAAVFLDAPPEGAVAEKTLDPLLPPASIRVGTSCSCTSCSAVSVMSLESYVKRGLNDEWIASWHQNSLRAGSVAYRSYGAWYVDHPISGSYDICSTTCCQVNDSDTSSSTDEAADATAGFMLSSGGSIFRSEYSAENNSWDDPGDGLGCSNSDLSCGDGSAGSPSTGWSCISDPLCAGHGCFGHGRGMCQWGTQRRASTSGESWTDIVDHYFNDFGSGTGQRTAQMTTPMWIESVDQIPPTFSSFRIDLEARSATQSDNEPILIGASIYSAATGYLSDPAHDQPVVLNEGTNLVSRLFDIPAGTPEGLYDLYVSLYYDVDGDGSITTADKALDLVSLSDAVTISAEIFSDGFETGDLRNWSVPQ